VALNSRGILQGLMATSSSVSLVGPLLNLWSVIQRDDSAYRQLVTVRFRYKYDRQLNALSAEDV